MCAHPARSHLRADASSTDLCPISQTKTPRTSAMSVGPASLARSRDSRSGSRSSAGQAFHPAIKTRAGEISGIGSQSARVPIVPRPSLVGRLMLSDEPLVVISAPAGYGKTTLLHQWAAMDERPFAWVGLSASDNDPARLAEHLKQALLAAGALCRRRLVLSTTLDRPGAEALWSVVSHPTEIAAVVPALSPVVIVLDDSQELTDPTATALLETTLDCLPQASRLVFAGRARPRLPLGHLQVQGRVLRVGPEDLSLAPEDGARLIEAVGLRVNRRSQAKLLEVTEGWPAGLALAATSLRSRRDPDLDARNFDGSDLAMAEYLDEVLDQLDQASLDFLTETSVLERFSPALCDAVRQRDGSAAIIKSLERSNVFLVPLDRRGEWYRYHKLFAGYLQARRRHTLGRATTQHCTHGPAAGGSTRGTSMPPPVTRTLPETSIGSKSSSGSPPRTSSPVTAFPSLPPGSGCPRANRSRRALRSLWRRPG